MKPDRLGGSVMVWAGIHHDGRTALVRVNGALSDQIYQDEILQHHIIPLINVTGCTHQFDSVRPHCTSLPRFSTAKQRSCLTMGSKIGSFIPNRTPGSQSLSKEASATNTTGIVLDFTELMANMSQCTIQNVIASYVSLCSCTCRSEM